MVWCGVLRTGFGGPLCAKKSRATFWPQSAPASDPNVRKEWMNIIFNEDPDCVSKNLVLCSLHFTADSFTNKAQFDAGFKKNRN